LHRLRSSPRSAWQRTIAGLLAALMLSVASVSAQQRDDDDAPPGETAEGVVDAVDLDRRLLTLEDGTTFLLAEAVDAEVIEEGESVFIVFRYDDREQKVAVEVLLSDQQ
jgi:hypothetical protein